MKKRFLYLSLVLAFLATILQPALAQDRVISGKVTDENGESLPGVNVVVKGTTVGTSTDLEGMYKLSVPADATTLVFSFVSYVKQEIEIGANAVIDVKLMPDLKVLEEVVVVGYGTQSKKDISASVASIGEADFNPGPIVNPLQKIAGRAAGVSVTQVGSEPGTSPSIRIRGITSLVGSSDPLVVVDGIQGGMDLLRQIPPSEIETFDILKDASATAIYGARGAAGVVLITTKKGKEDQSSVEFSSVFSVETIAKKYDMLSASEWREEAIKRGRTSADRGGNTNWMDEITRTGYTQNNNFAFSAGGANFNYRASITAINQQGIIIGSSSDTYMGRFQATQRALNDKLTLTYNMNIAYDKKTYNNGAIGGAVAARPTDPIYASDGSYFIDNGVFGYRNAYARAKEIIDGGTGNSLFGSMKADYKIVDGLTASVFGSLRRSDGLSGSYLSPKTTDQAAIAQKGIANRGMYDNDERLFNGIINYKKTFGDHNLDFTGVYEWQQVVNQGFRVSARGFVNDFTTYNALQSANLTQTQDGDIFSYKNDRTLASVLGRLNYSFKGRYVATVSMRQDGSSLFGVNNQWATFPAVSLAWKLSEESFFDGIDFINDLKVRAGFGVTGSMAGLEPQGARRLVAPDGTAFFGGSLIPNYAIRRNANPDLKWETKEMVNAGIDFAMFGSKLTGTIDVFNGTTRNLLFFYAVPSPPYPVTEINANVGKVRNKGIEVSLGYKLIDNDDLGVTLAGNLTSLRNEVIELSGSIDRTPLNTDYVVWGSGGTTGVAGTNNGILYLIKGQPLGTFYLFKHAGVDGQGNQLIDDINADGTVTQGNVKNPDRYIAGQALPKLTYAFTPSVRYKNFDLNMVIRGVYGNKIYNARKSTLSAMSQFGQSNVASDAISNGIENITYATNFWLESGSFLRFENLTLGYRVKTENMKAIQSLRLSLTANNLFVITKYTGIDPEQRADGSGGFGIDGGIYPRTRNIALGLNISLK